MLIYLDGVDANLIKQLLDNHQYLNKVDRMTQKRIKRIIGSINAGLENYTS